MTILVQKLKARFYDRLDEHMAEVVRGASVAFVLKILGAGLAFGFNVLLARLLGAQGAGIYFLSLTVVTIGMTVGMFGLDNTLLRFVAANAAKGEWKAVKGVYRKGMALSVGVSLLVILAIELTAPWFARVVFSKPELTVPLRWMALAVLPMAMVFLHGESIKALKRIRDSQLVNGVAVPGFSILGLVLLGRSFGVRGAAWAYLGAAALAALGGVLVWRKATPQLKKSPSQMPLGEVLHTSVPLFWMAVMNMVMNWAPTFFLGIWGSKADVGIFGAAWRTAMLTSFILISVNSIVAPKFAALYSQGDLTGLSSTAKKSTAMMILLAAPILLIFLIAPGLVMGVFGGQFQAGSRLLTILAIGQFVNVATGSVGYLLMMCGRERLMRNNTLIVGALSLALSGLLIPFFGALGAAIAGAISLALLNLGAFYLVWKTLGIWTIPLLEPR